MSNSAPQVSIVMPVYNAEGFIGRSIDSVLGQTFGDFELIVIDDASQDGSASIAEGYTQDGRVLVTRLGENSGPARARNEGISRARGRFIAFLDADDIWSPHKLERQIGVMLEHNWGFTYTEYFLLNESDARIGSSGKLRSSVTYDRLLAGCIIQNSTAVYDTHASGGLIYCPDVRKRQDFGLFLRVLQVVPEAHLVPDSGDACGYRMVAGSVSSRKFKNIPFQWGIYREIEGLSVRRSAVLLARWFVYSALKNVRRRIRR